MPIMSLYGKTLVAQAIHQQSNRADKPLVIVECTGLSEQLFESEVFGHEKGAFAQRTKRRYSCADRLFFLAQSEGTASKISKVACEILCWYNYPGNIRELKTVMQQASIMCDGNTIGREDLPHELLAETNSEPPMMTSNDVSIRDIKLPSGNTIPAFGLGTWRMGEQPQRFKEEAAVIRSALDLGIR